MLEGIGKGFEVWSAAVANGRSAGRGSNGKTTAYGVKKLRELILELAVRGKLVPQDPADEPASVLLEKIAEEKERLIGEGEIKKQRPLPAIEETEVPFELPDSWDWVRLQEISSYLQRGKGPKYAEHGQVRVVSQKCIQWSGFDLTQARYVDDHSLGVYQPERYLRKNDLLWNSTGTGTVGRVNVLDEVDSDSLVADSHVTVIRVLRANCSFLRCYIAAPGIQARIEPDHEMSLVSGTTKQVELNTSVVASLVVPLPPLAEQHRIVAKVDELMALCDALESEQSDSMAAHERLVECLLGTLTAAEDAHATADAWQPIADHFDTLFTTEHSIDQLKQAILQLAVMGKLVPQDPADEPNAIWFESNQRTFGPADVQLSERRFTIPYSWFWARFTDLGNTRLGKMLDIQKNRGNPKPYLRNTNVQWMRFDLSDLKSMRLEESEESEFRVRKGDLLICEGGEPGRCAIWSDDSFEVYFQKALHRVRPHDYVLAEYLALNLLVDARNGVLERLFTGATIKHLTGKSLTRYAIPLPPLAEQHRIVAKVDELMALCDTLKARLSEAQTTQMHLADAVVAGPCE